MFAMPLTAARGRTFAEGAELCQERKCADVLPIAPLGARRFSRKITVLTMAKDRALGAMRDMAGGVTRLGIAKKAQLGPLGLRVVDASEYGLNHDLFLTNGQVREVIRRVMDEARPPRCEW